MDCYSIMEYIMWIAYNAKKQLGYFTNTYLLGYEENPTAFVLEFNHHFFSH